MNWAPTYQLLVIMTSTLVNAHLAMLKCLDVHWFGRLPSFDEPFEGHKIRERYQSTCLC